MKSFCPNFFTNVMNDSLGVYKTCCLHAPKTENNITEGVSVDRPIEEFWNSPVMMESRLKSIKGEPIQGCEACYEAEAGGGTSLRKDLSGYYENDREFLNKVTKARKNNGYLEDFPSSIEFRVGNLCNLKCRMCQPQDSNLINNEYKEIHLEFPGSNAKDILPIINVPVNVNMVNYIESLKNNVDQIDIIRFSGGEPLINQSFLSLIDHFLETGKYVSLDLRINTNLTKITEPLLNKLKKFKKLSIDFSIDGVKNGYEYIRFPMKWSVIEKKIELLHSFLIENSNIKVNANFTVQTYNVLHMMEFIDYFIPKGFTPILHPVINPRYLSIQNIPDSLKLTIIDAINKKVDNLKDVHSDNVNIDWVISKLIALKNITNLPTEVDEIERFIEFTEILDNKRNQNFQKTFPEVSSHFKHITSNGGY